MCTLIFNKHHYLPASVWGSPWGCQGSQPVLCGGAKEHWGVKESASPPAANSHRVGTNTRQWRHGEWWDFLILCVWSIINGMQNLTIMATCINYTCILYSQKFLPGENVHQFHHLLSLAKCLTHTHVHVLSLTHTHTHTHARVCTHSLVRMLPTRLLWLDWRDTAWASGSLLPTHHQPNQRLRSRSKKNRTSQMVRWVTHVRLIYLGVN